MLSSDLESCSAALEMIIGVKNTEPEIECNALLKCASMHDLRHDLDQTYYDIEEAMKISPDIADTYYHRAQLHMKMGSGVKALEDSKTTCEVSRDFISART